MAEPDAYDAESTAVEAAFTAALANVLPATAPLLDVEAFADVDAVTALAAEVEAAAALLVSTFVAAAELVVAKTRVFIAAC
ncbi:hypothetical protein [Schleiferilactobacillus perolens]|uniref:hypothetical protein n=1 Tax=Schleiferilactobacillus perolens TaxID=100468 RepID=UPI0023531603|nr:hypothetical protein [Schleiferilactobacillus perolens]MCI2172279.1 hypothetical protein [Schleiferilactobacillus perolens]